jgi:ABC-type multidrug transport system fused ATPase/permease subunit
LGSARRVFTLVDLPAEVDCERAGRRPAAAAAAAAAATAAPVPGELTAGKAQPLRFVDFSMSYRPGGREALHGVELTLPPGRRVGLVGRTGSGKSSLIQALLRMVHVTRGDILVGERSIYELDLEQWRALFAIVPQSPHLFAGTVRGNLDRLGLFGDDLLRLALGRVGLSFEPEMTIAPGGANLSLGERQLLCMARALLVQRPFLILDEPTSAMDNLTDARVQAALREVSRDVTVLTIAHRLETIASYDLIVEMSDGRVASVTAKDSFLISHP